MQVNINKVVKICYLVLIFSGILIYTIGSFSPKLYIIKHAFVTYQYDSDQLILNRYCVDVWQHNFTLLHAPLIINMVDGGKVFNDKVFTNDCQLPVMMQSRVQFMPYTSSVGLQGVILSTLGRALHLKRDAFKYSGYFLEVLLLSGVLYLLSEAVLSAFGKQVNLGFLILLFFYAGLVKVAHSLYWNAWIMCLPFTLSMLRICIADSIFKNNMLYLFTLFGIFLLKSLFGMEMISTIIISATVPLFYQGLQDKKFYTTVKLMLQVAGCGIMAFMLNLALWCYQLGFSAFKTALLSDIARRLLFNFSWLKPYLVNLDSPQSKQAGYLITMWLELRANNMFGHASFSVLLVALLVTMLWSYSRGKRNSASELPEGVKQLRDLQYTSIYALLAPLSWIILAKPHVYVHKEILNGMMCFSAAIFIYLSIAKCFVSGEPASRWTGNFLNSRCIAGYIAKKHLVS